MRCDQCQMATINGLPCHEHGCSNRNSRWDRWAGESGQWVKQFACPVCGFRADVGTTCCEAE